MNLEYIKKLWANRLKVGHTDIEKKLLGAIPQLIAALEAAKVDSARLGWTESTQIFKIIRAPETRPIEARELRQMLHSARVDSEWEVWQLETHELCAEKEQEE